VNNMSIKERKARHKEELRLKILEAAKKIFAEDKYENISMRKIAAIIEYSPTTIYRYFKNKDELLEALTTETYKDLSALFEKIKADETLDPLAKLKALIIAYTHFCLENPDIYKLYVNHCTLEMGERSFTETVGGVRYRVFNSWYALIDECIRQEIFKETDAFSILLLLLNTTHGLIMHRIKQPTLPWKSHKEEIDSMIEMIFYGLLKP
jgi:AcrR family transcriptional regulator